MFFLVRFDVFVAVGGTVIVVTTVANIFVIAVILITLNTSRRFSKSSRMGYTANQSLVEN